MLFDVQLHSIEEPDDLARHMLPPRLLVIHDASRCGENNVAELTGRKELHDPLLEVSKLNVVSGGDNTSLVQATVELDDNLAVAVVINFLEFTNVAF